MPSANARHILVDSQELCEELIAKIKAGEDFAVLAKEYSSCPSGQRGGDLGDFQKGMMVPAFDAVIFDTNNAVNEVYFQPVKTQFGYHVIEVLSRED
jgi:peptidyl-prolyl cis-trans isomerase C